MDVIGGLTAAKLAIDLAKDLRDIDRSVDEAAFKLKLADLTSALADTQVALADAKVRMSDLEAELANKSHGDLCPVCRNGRLRVQKVTPYEHRVGLEFHRSTCDNSECSYSNERAFDANQNRYKGG